MQQVVDLPKDPKFRSMSVAFLSISPDPVSAWRSEGGQLGIITPMLSDAGNRVWLRYGTPSWMMATNEPGHAFVLVDRTGHVAWIRDYGAPEHGGVMYVDPSEIARQVQTALSR